MPVLLDHAPWDDYAARVAELYAPLTPDDGLPEYKLVAAESALGFRLPRVLREFYLVAGARTDLTRGAMHPVAPENLCVADHALLISAWDLGFPYYGILEGEMGHEDPSVVVSDGDPRPFDWASDHERLSTWFVSMLYWVAVNGGLPYSGVAPVDETEIPAVHEHWPKVDLLGSFWEHRIVFHRAGQVVCIDGRPPDLTLHAAGRTAEDFAAITRRLRLPWETAEEGA